MLSNNERIRKALRTLLQSAGLRRCPSSIGICTDESSSEEFEFGVPGIFVRVQDSGNLPNAGARIMEERLNQIIYRINQYFEQPVDSVVRIIPAYRVPQETKESGADDYQLHFGEKEEEERELPNNALMVDANFFSIPENLTALEQLASLASRKTMFQRLFSR